MKGVGPKRAELLQKLGVYTLEDLLYHLPRRYEDRTRFVTIAQAVPGEPVTLKGRVALVDVTSARSGMALVKARLDDDTGSLELVWFNQRWMKERLQNKPHEFVFFGIPQESGWGLTMSNPEWEPLEPNADPLGVGRIVPIYPLTEGISQKVIRQILHRSVVEYAGRIDELLPAELRRKYDLGGIEKCLMQAHFPDKMEYVEIARRRLVFEEFLGLQLGLAVSRAEVSLEPGIAFEIADDLFVRFTSNLPFELTKAQQRVIRDIWHDMAQPRPMNRLIQGDVGSGKTVVAAAAIVAAVSAGYQAAMMAPTEILAGQHHANISKVLERFDIRPELLVGRLSTKQKADARERILNRHATVVVGTHALVQESLEFGRLGLAIVDEQHRFGVLQRATLAQKGVNPDVLVMTATPIPRTLTMTLYGDLDVSIIDEMPVGRKPIRTKWKREEDRQSVYDGVRELITQGHQAYLVCPLVESSEKLQSQAAVVMADKLRNDIFPDLKVGLIHGQMKAVEKDDVMERFRQGEVDILVATTVIEVGVDVPNASVMVIEDAHRFGLAQLHQLRGRVGRGDRQSYCILIADARTEDAVQRMTTMINSTDGFVIAETDLRLRGPGEVFGTKQSGIPVFRVADLVRDQQLLEEARTEAFEIVKEDRKLELPKNRLLRVLLQRSRSRISVANVG